MKSRQFITFFSFFLILFVVVAMLADKPERDSRDELPTGWSHYLIQEDIESIVSDQQYVWVGGRDGVWKLDRATGQLIGKVITKVPMHFVQSILLDNSDTLWVAHNSGLTAFKGNEARLYTGKDGLPDDRVNTVMLDNQGSLWAGTWGGAARMQGDRWVKTIHSLASPENMIRVMLQDRSGGLWLGSYVAPLGGVLHDGNGDHKMYNTANGLPHNNVTSLWEDNEGAIWAGTGLYERGGLAKFMRDQSGWKLDRVLTKADGLAGAKVRSVFQDSTGIYWIGSEYDGLALGDGTSWMVINVDDGLSHPEIKCVSEDVDGNMWLGTRHGVTRINKSAAAHLRQQFIHESTEQKGTAGS